MATVNLSVTIPDALMPRVLQALRAHFGQVPLEGSQTGEMRDRTPAELQAKLREQTVANIKQIVAEVEARQAAIAAEASAKAIQVD
jgi:hypothetical protein